MTATTPQFFNFCVRCSFAIQPSILFPYQIEPLPFSLFYPLFSSLPSIFFRIQFVYFHSQFPRFLFHISQSGCPPLLSFFFVFRPTLFLDPYYQKQISPFTYRTSTTQKLYQICLRKSHKSETTNIRKNAKQQTHNVRFHNAL